MFKKPLSNLKTSAPLRSSDRRKLKQRVVQDFGLQPDDGDLLVPEGLQSQKFATHVNELGVVYLSPEGDPLWFTIGKDSQSMIPTVYTLWKKPDLLAFLSTPAVVITKLIDGADLMIPGVVQHSSDLVVDQLVSISQYHRDKLGPPLAVGQMAVSGETLDRADNENTKGKAVYVLHTWRDCLWELGPGKKTDVPEARNHPPKDEAAMANAELPSADGNENATAEVDSAHETTENDTPGVETAAVETDRTAGDDESAAPVLTPEETSSVLRNALLQAISTTLRSLAPSAFPMSMSIFWSSHVLPCRPAFVREIDGHTVDIKHSTHKSVKVFLKVAAKEGLVKLKESKGEIVITGVSSNHPAVAGHHSYRTVQAVDTQRERAEQRERTAREAEEERRRQIHVVELWKPHGSTIPLFVAAQADTENLYSASDVRAVFMQYVQEKSLVNANDAQFVDVGQDIALQRAVAQKNDQQPNFLKRPEAVDRIRANMQEWYELHSEGNEVVRRKGKLSPIRITPRVRQGRKMATFINGFEAFGIEANTLSEELSKMCASSTSVSPLPGKNTEQEVMVQGEHRKIVTDFLVARGVPEQWVKSTGIKGGKGKKK